MTRRASCGCGALVVTCAAEPLRVGLCHCTACQRRTGSAYGVQARFARDAVTVEGPVHRWVRIGDSGGRVTFGACPVCASTVFWEPDGMPDFVVVAVGAFADPTFPGPTVSVYEERRLPWAALPPTVVDHID